MAKLKKPKRLDWLQPAVLTGSILPFLVIAWRAGAGDLGANPVETALNQLGLLAILFLLSSLACTPIKIITGAKWPMRLRKTLGLMAFFAVLAHFLLYFVFDRMMMMTLIVEDVLKRPFIAIGFCAFVLLVPLAITSTKNALHKLGPKRWKLLHRLAYVVGVLGIVHFVMRVKKDVTEPLIYGAVLAFLLSVRLLDYVSRRRRSGRTTSEAGT